MEIRIGIQHTAREVSFTSHDSVEDIERAVARAIASGEMLVMTDDKGGRVLVPSSTIGYIQMGPAEQGRVGFGIG